MNNNTPIKQEDLEKRYKYLEQYNLPTLNHEKVENLNRWIISKEIDLVITTSQQTKVWQQTALLVNSAKHSKI